MKDFDCSAVGGGGKCRGFVPLEPITSIFFDLDGTLCDPREAE